MLWGSKRRLFKGIFRAATISFPPWHSPWLRCCEENVTLCGIIPHRLWGFRCGGSKWEGIEEIDVGHCYHTTQISVHLRRLQHWGEKKSLFIRLFNSSNAKAAFMHVDVKLWCLCFNVNTINRSMFSFMLHSVLLFSHMFTKQRVSQWMKWCSGSGM